MPPQSNTPSPDDPDESADNTRSPAALAQAIVHALTTSEQSSESTPQSDSSSEAETGEPVDHE